MEKETPSTTSADGNMLLGVVNNQTIGSQDDTIDHRVVNEELKRPIDSLAQAVDQSKQSVNESSVVEASIVIEEEESKIMQDDESSLASPDPSGSDKTAQIEKRKIKQAANAESPVLKSQEIFGAVKVKDGLFLGD